VTEGTRRQQINRAVIRLLEAKGSSLRIKANRQLETLTDFWTGDDETKRFVMEKLQAAVAIK